MSLWMMGWGLVTGDGTWRMPQLISTVILSSDAYTGGQTFNLTPVMVGFLLHELTSAAMGLLYALLIRLPLLRLVPLWTAVIYAFISWIVAELWLFPFVSATLAAESRSLPVGLAHIVFGLVLGLYALRVGEPLSD
ncbi:MAG: hypothetical protein R3272_07030 [Candidatus Promineifilaceae bacterium]|nr:hypothetical protein [Candidatus Promineifilaceae bacterium]